MATKKEVDEITKRITELVRRELEAAELKKKAKEDQPPPPPAFWEDGTKAPRAKLDPKLVDPKWRKEMRTCPKCGFTGDVATYFGVVVDRRYGKAVERRQSYCANCRNKISYRNQPRKHRPHKVSDD